MRATDLWLAFPVLLLTIAVAAVVGPSVELVIVIIATTLWTATARIVYMRMVILRGSAFVEASRALGGSGPHIFWRHHLPNVSPLLVVYASLGIAATILFEATLSYLGVGVPPPTPTWGTMLADHIGRFVTDPRLVMLPGFAITITVLAFNLLGDSLRDAMDPRSWGAR
jgi:peptide/nickel transport system permease protein